MGVSLLWEMAFLQELCHELDLFCKQRLTRKELVTFPISVIFFDTACLLHGRERLPMQRD
jgi:hypothetical protein